MVIRKLGAVIIGGQKQIKNQSAKRKITTQKSKIEAYQLIRAK